MSVCWHSLSKLRWMQITSVCPTPLHSWRHLSIPPVCLHSHVLHSAFSLQTFSLETVGNLIEPDLAGFFFVTYTLLISWRSQWKRCGGWNASNGEGGLGAKGREVILTKYLLQYASQLYIGLSHLRKTHLLRLWTQRLVCWKECTCIGRGEDLHVSQALSLLILFLFLSLNKQHRSRALKKKNIIHHLKTALFPNMSLFVLCFICYFSWMLLVFYFFFFRTFFYYLFVYHVSPVRTRR